MKKRLLSVLLALCMALALLPPGTALAAQKAEISIRSGKWADNNGGGGEVSVVNGDTVYIPAGATVLVLDILAPTTGGLIFSKDCESVSTGGPNSNLIIIGGNCGLAATGINNAQTAMQLSFTGAAKPGTMDITIHGFASVDDPTKLATDENGHVLGSNTLHVVVEGADTPPQPPQPAETGVRVDFFPNGGVITSIRGYSREQIMSPGGTRPEDILFIDVNSGIAGMMTGQNGRLAALPVVEREGYTFDGWWYTDDSNVIESAYSGEAAEFTSRLRVDTSTDFRSLVGRNGSVMGIIAKWTKTGAERDNTHEVWFHSNGGKVTSVLGVTVDESGVAEGVGWFDQSGRGDGTVGLMLTDKSGKLPGLPVIEREGYSFDGWYTLETGGSKVTADTVSNGVPQYEQVHLWAHWTEGYTVTFSLNGAPGDVPKAQRVAKGGTIDLPPAPVWTGYTFLGWVSGDISGNRIVNAVLWTDTTEVTEDVTLYAAWKEDGDLLGGLTYRFGNNAQVFGYPEGYEIPLPRYQMVFGDTEEADFYYRWGGPWDGSCYGMAATSGMFFSGAADAASFRSGAQIPFDLAVRDKSSALGLDLTEYIEAVFVSQFNAQIQEDYCTPADLNRLCEAADAVQDTMEPVMISIWGGEGGHSVLGYDVEEVSTTESHLMIYDPNFPNTERYITLNRSGGRYTAWSYKMNDTYLWGSSNPESAINMISYSHYSQAWANRARQTGGPAALYVSAKNASITDSTGAVAASIRDGNVTVSGADVYPIRTIGLTDGGKSPAGSGTLLSLPAGEYTVTAGGAEEFTAAMVDVDQSATVTTTASSVTFLVDDDKTANSVQISGIGESYDITLSSTLDQGYKEVSLTGTTAAETTAAAQISGKLYGTDLDAGGSIQVDGKDADGGILAGTVPGTVSAQPPQTIGINPFTDVPSSAYYHDAVLWAAANGIAAGTSSATFSPNASCTRAQTVTFLWRAAGSPAPQGSTNPFTDVRPGSYYYDAVLWAAEQGIASGTSATTFSPNAAVTRAQTVTFLYRAAGSPAASGGTPFGDVDSGAYYADAVRWAVSRGVAAGTSATAFSPNSDCTRAQIVTFLYRDRAN